MSAKIVVIGANGYLGRALVRRLLQCESFAIDPDKDVSIAEITLFDLNLDYYQKHDTYSKHPKLTLFQGDLCRESDVRQAVQPNKETERVIVYLIAAVLSGNAESNFDLGLQVNLHASMALLEILRQLGNQMGQPQTLVYTSSDYVACFNDTNRRVAFSEEGYRQSPTSYGIQKACVELLVCDYARRGFVDGRVGRISAMIGRPGFSNSVSSAFSMIFSQTLKGIDYQVPLPMDASLPCSSLENNADCLILLGGKISGQRIGDNRIIQLPARSYTLEEIWMATQEAANRHGLQLGALERVNPNEAKTTFTQINVVPTVDCSKASNLGLPNDIGLGSIICNFLIREGLVHADS